jgi:hypothetical protein
MLGNPDFFTQMRGPHDAMAVAQISMDLPPRRQFRGDRLGGIGGARRRDSSVTRLVRFANFCEWLLDVEGCTIRSDKRTICMPARRLSMPARRLTWTG